MRFQYAGLLLAACGAWAAAVPSFTPQTVDRVPVSRPMARVGRPVEFWMSPLSAAEQAPAMIRPGLLRAGVHRMGGDEFLRRGQWSELPDGRAVFQAAMRLPGAASLRLELVNFAAGRGQVWLYPGDVTEGARPVGPYDGGEDRWTGVVEGESVVLEFAVAAGAPRILPFQVGRISHIFSKIGPDGAPRAAGVSCNLDVTCFPEWAERAKGVARYVFETSAGTAVCSGSLINTRNSSGIPYFLTANQCVSNEAEAVSVQAFWFYQSSICNGAPPVLATAPTTAGASFLAGGAIEQGDFTLLRLTGPLPNGVTFAGWTQDELPMGAAVTGIHHPDGDFKRISFGNRAAMIATPNRPEPKYHTIAWRTGVTQTGSTGSPIFTSDGILVGILSAAPKPPNGGNECDLTPATAWYGRFSAAYPALQDWLEERTTGPDPAATLLANNVAVNFTAGPLTREGMVPEIYRVEVPQGATRLEIRLRTTTPNVDFDLFVRAGSAPELIDAMVADYSSTSASGDETIVILPNTYPALRPGTYFVSMILRTLGVEAKGTLTALISTGTTPPPTSGAVALTSGTALPFTLEAGLPGARLRSGKDAFKIEVPRGATRLEIKLETQPQNFEGSLLARFNTESEVVNGGVVVDHRAERQDGNLVITITPASSPALRAGTYFINILEYYTETTQISARLTATITESMATGLTSGVARAITMEPVAPGTLLSGANAYWIDVPAGATRLEIRREMLTPNADVDFLIRYSAEATVQGASFVADHRIRGGAADDRITILPASSPALRAGTYFIHPLVLTGETRIPARLTAVVTMSGGPTPPPTVLVTGVARAITLESTRASTMLTSSSSAFRVDVPQGAERLEIRLESDTPGVAVDLFARFNAESTLVSTGVIADHRSEGPDGNELITITSTSSPVLRPGTYFISLLQFAGNNPFRGRLTATVTRGNAPPPIPATLTSGVARGIVLVPETADTLLTGSRAFQIDVPQGATRLEIRLEAPEPGLDIDLYARFNTETVRTSSGKETDHRAEGPDGNEVITITSTSSPALRPGKYFINLLVFAGANQVTARLTATVTSGGTIAPAPPAVATLLSSGVARAVTVEPSASGALVFGREAYRIEVPQGATRLEVRLDIGTQNANLDLFTRFGSESAVEVFNVVTDRRSENPGSAAEVISIASSAAQPLRGGTYFINLRAISENTRVQALLTATVTAGTSPPPPAASPVVLTSGTARAITLEPVASASLLGGNDAYRIDVPQGATRLEIRLETQTPNVDVDLYARFNMEASEVGGAVVADHRSEGADGNELITITPSSSPALRAGTYFVNLGVFTANTRISAQLTATVTTGTPTPAPPPAGGNRPLTSGVATAFSYGPVNSATLFTDDEAFRITVPEGATRLEVRVRTTSPGVDLDLYILTNQLPAVINGSINHHYWSEGNTGDETIVITPQSSPPLRAGTYFIALRLITKGVRAEGTVLATVTTASSPAPAVQTLTAGVSQRFTIAPTPSPDLIANPSFQINVPAGIARIRVVLRTTTPNADVDLFARFAEAPAVSSAGGVVADYRSEGATGDESLEITAQSKPPLRTGTLFISLALFTAGVQVEGTMTVFLDPM